VFPPDYPRIKRVRSFDELVSIPLTGGLNALYWERTLTGDFGEVVAGCPSGEGIVTLDESQLEQLPVGAAGRIALAVLREDLRRLRELDRDPMLNCIHAYPRDESPGPVSTDVLSFHVDTAPVEADTWLCTYFGPPSEGLRNDQAQRRVDDPATRAELLKQYGGSEDEAFTDWLTENHYDLHYAPLPGAKPYSFGVGHLWRIVCENTGLLRHNSPERRRAPPCIHRAPATQPGDPPRLLLIC
jgi:hypothetical protein